MKPIYFDSAAEFGAWLECHGQDATELVLGFHKTGSGHPGITYREALDEALCFGWIDGVRRSVNVHSYSIRFSPRKAKSTWSRINTKRAQELSELGRLRPAGVEAFEARTPERSGIYSFENSARKLDRAYEKDFKRNEPAWSFFRSRPPWYQRTASWWVMSAKKEETRRRRLATLIGDSAQCRTIKPLTRPA